MPVIVVEPPVDTAGGVFDLGALVAARLADQTAFTVYRGTVPTTPPGAYVVLRFDAGRAHSDRLDGSPKVLRWTFSAVCAGRSEQQTLHTLDLVRQRLTGWRPQPVDRACGVLNEVDGGPLLRDDSVPADIRFSMTLLYRLTTTRSL